MLLVWCGRGAINMANTMCDVARPESGAVSRRFWPNAGTEWANQAVLNYLVAWQQQMHLHALFTFDAILAVDHWIAASWITVAHYIAQGFEPLVQCVLALSYV